ncbi:MAG: hypothetical protein A2096_14785 [Spirochaetes bacterium GWF1_41_5]|nr:MAG: hypothetical protein A2096_14785 [Spirochaetes bacterium GWF1_41_5]HBE03296.1 hypothetical protein [Spirochaetia bacterium]
MKKSSAEIIHTAFDRGIAVPAFNIPYLPMMEPVIRALSDTGSFGFIMVARLEWIKFESGSPEKIAENYHRLKNENHTRLHLDHIPVIDEDNLRVDFMSVLERAVKAGYESLMIDGSRLGLSENIKCTQDAAGFAHQHNIPIEAELGAVLGHEKGPLPSYEELFASGRGFTSIAEAGAFISASGADWLSIAAGNIHGPISEAARTQQKIQARLDTAHIAGIREKAGVPLVLHGGTGIHRDYVQEAIKNGIAKINIATAIRQPYEKKLNCGTGAAQNAVYEAMIHIINNELAISGLAEKLA